jgi:hypothetical protein
MKMLAMLLEEAEKNAIIRERYIIVLSFLLTVNSDKWKYFMEGDEMSDAHIL